MNNIKVNKFKVLTDSVEVDKKIKDAIGAIPPSVTEAKVKQVIQTDVPPMITARLTDYATKTDLGTKADKATTYTKTQVDNLITASEGKIVGENRIKEIIREDVPAIVDGRISGLATKAEVNLKADKASVYEKSQTYSKEEVYSKTEAYRKAEVYSKLETYNRNEIDNKIAGGGGGGGTIVTVTDFKVDPNDPFQLNIHLSDGTVKSEKLLDMHKEYLRGYEIDCTSYTSNLSDGYVWKEDNIQLDTEYHLPLKAWAIKKRKGNCQVLNENGYDYIRFPEGDMKLEYWMNINACFREPTETSPVTNTGEYERKYRAYTRPIGTTEWTLAGESTHTWYETNTKTIWVSFRNYPVKFESPAGPFEVRFVWLLTKFGEDPSDMLGKTFKFGLTSYGAPFPECGISVYTEKLVKEIWYDYD